MGITPKICTMSEEEAELTVVEVAKKLGVNPETVRRWIWTKKIPAIKRGKQLYIKKKDLFLLGKDEFFILVPANQTFVEVVGDQLVQFLGKKEPICIIALYPDGPFYALPLQYYLSMGDIDVSMVTFDINKKGEIRRYRDKIHGRKIILVDNDTRSGTTVERAKEILLDLKEELKFKGESKEDIKLAVLDDFANIADFYVNQPEKA